MKEIIEDQEFYQTNILLRWEGQEIYLIDVGGSRDLSN